MVGIIGSTGIEIASSVNEAGASALNLRSLAGTGAMAGVIIKSTIGVTSDTTADQQFGIGGMGDTVLAGMHGMAVGTDTADDTGSGEARQDENSSNQAPNQQISFQHTFLLK